MDSWVELHGKKPEATIDAIVGEEPRGEFVAPETALYRLDLESIERAVISGGDVNHVV